MAKLKTSDIRELSTEELVEKIQSTSLQLKKLRFNHAVSQLENPLEVRTHRKNIARLQTELRRRELQG